ncbi:alpha/beta fold hydrolase [Promicromonospora sp. MS192]|uniref:alpha/beta fold hydrolase n=1 Tax=Promicromonospora sp. MS192 TaxID=3412684 RepID=UPI003C2E1848
MTIAPQHPVHHVEIRHTTVPHTQAPHTPTRHTPAPHPTSADPDTVLRLAYREAGDPAAPPLLLLHALGESSLSWDPLLDDLAALGHRVLAPDARGHGDSGRPGQYSYELMTADTLAFCAALELHSAPGPDAALGLHSVPDPDSTPYPDSTPGLSSTPGPDLARWPVPGPASAPGGLAVVGHSMGAVTASLVTAALERATSPAAGTIPAPSGAPARVTRLVLEDTTVPRPGGARFEPFDEPGHPVPFDWPLVNALRAQRSDPDPAWWADALRIQAPVLVVAGGPDSSVDQADLVRFADEVADGRLAEIRVGHMVHDEDPEEFLAVVGEFLRP